MENSLLALPPKMARFGFADKNMVIIFSAPETMAAYLKKRLIRGDLWERSDLIVMVIINQQKCSRIFLVKIQISELKLHTQ